MVAVGDEQRALGDLARDGAQGFGIGHLREAMGDAVGGGELGHRARRVERAVEHALLVAVEHEARAQIGAGCTEKLETIFFWSGQGALVREHDSFGERSETNRGQEALARDRAALGKREGLVVAEVSRFVVADEHATRAHTGEDVRRVAVARVSLALGKDQADHIFGVPRGQRFALFGRDDVVGRCDDTVERGACEVVAERGERGNLGHLARMIPRAHESRAHARACVRSGTERGEQLFGVHTTEACAQALERGITCGQRRRRRGRR